MKKLSSNALLCVILILISFLLYTVQLIVFHASHDTFFYFLQDMAFLPLQVAIVTIVIGRILTQREKRDRLKKINMAVSAFFSEAGTSFLTNLIKLASNHADIQNKMNLKITWESLDFEKALIFFEHTKYSISCNSTDLESLKEMLLDKRNYMLRMLENPNLLEHDTFTDMLLAVFHVTEELIARDHFVELPDSDINHLVLDIERALRTLLIQWIGHMEHLHSDYPYLYSLEVRRNPFTIRKVLLWNKV